MEVSWAWVWLWTGEAATRMAGGATVVDTMLENLLRLCAGVGWPTGATTGAGAWTRFGLDTGGTR